MTKYIVDAPVTEQTFTYANVLADGRHVGRIVYVSLSDTWGPDANLTKATGRKGRWNSYEAAKAAIEGES